MLVRLKSESGKFIGIVRESRRYDCSYYYNDRKFYVSVKPDRMRQRLKAYKAYGGLEEWARRVHPDWLALAA